MYSTVSLVREVSGLRSTAKISNDRVKGKIIRADAMIDGYLVQKYQMPLIYRRACAITFSGTGTGTATLTLTIGGVAHALAITSGLTASQAADLLRVSLVGDDEVFCPDAIGSGEVVTIISRTTSADLSTANTEVTVTGSAAGGITPTVGTRFDRYPQLIEQLSADIAAALLLMDNFGLEEEGTTRDGMGKIALAKETLKMIQGVDSIEASLRVLDEVTGEEIATSGKPVPVGYPNTVSDDSGDTDPTFSVNSVW